MEFDDLFEMIKSDNKSSDLFHDDKLDHEENSWAPLPKPGNVLEESMLEINRVASHVVPPTVLIPPCEKKRGENYFIDSEEKILTTKKSVSIPLKFSNMDPSKCVRVYERYSDPGYKTNPVLCENKCIIEDPKVPPLQTESFIIRCNNNVESQFLLPRQQDGTFPFPSINLWPSDQSEFKFFLMFRCRNTCESHKRCNKNRDLIFEFFDSHNALLNTEEFKVRVCESPRRDHCSSNSRKRMYSEVKQEPSDLCNIQVTIPDPWLSSDKNQLVTIVNENGEASVLPNDNHSPSKVLISPSNYNENADLIVHEESPATTAFKPELLIIQMTTEQHQKAVLQLVENLGGKIIHKG